MNTVDACAAAFEAAAAGCRGSSSWKVHWGGRCPIAAAVVVGCQTACHGFSFALLGAVLGFPDAFCIAVRTRRFALQLEHLVRAELHRCQHALQVALRKWSGRRACLRARARSQPAPCPSLARTQTPSCQGGRTPVATRASHDCVPAGTLSANEHAPSPSSCRWGWAGAASKLPR